MRLEKPSGYRNFVRTPVAIVFSLLYLVLVCASFLFVPALRERYLYLLIPMGFGGHQLLMAGLFYWQTGVLYRKQLLIGLIALAAGAILYLLRHNA